MTCAKAQVELKGWFSGMSVGLFNARLIKSQLMKHTQTLTRSQKVGGQLQHCPARSEPCVLQAGKKGLGQVPSLYWAGQQLDKTKYTKC